MKQAWVSSFSANKRSDDLTLIWFVILNNWHDIFSRQTTVEAVYNNFSFVIKSGWSWWSEMGGGLLLNIAWIRCPLEAYVDDGEIVVITIQEWQLNEVVTMLQVWNVAGWILVTRLKYGFWCGLSWNYRTPSTGNWRGVKWRHRTVGVELRKVRFKKKEKNNSNSRE